MFAGIDLSPSSSALVLRDRDGGVLAFEHVQEEATKTDVRARIRMAERSWEIVRQWMPALTCLEDYDLGGRNQYVSYQIAEVAGILKWHYLSNHMPLSLVNPRKLKSYVKKSKAVTKMDVIRFAEAKGFVLPPKKPGGPGYYQRQREDLSDAFVLADMALQLNLHLEEGHPAKSGDIFLDARYGLAFRSDLLFNNPHFEEFDPHAADPA